MRTALPLALTATLALTGCDRVADSRLNPFNWFGGSQSAQPLTATGNVQPLVTADMFTRQVDGRIMVASVDTLDISRTPNGAIIRATGTADRQGAFNAQLVPVAQDGGTLVLAFRVEVPQDATQLGPAATRQVTVARVISRAQLASIRNIRVQGATNARVSSR